MRINTPGPHKHKPPPHTTDELCTCGMAASYRSHQPFWWRVTHRRKLWRNT